MPAPEGAGQAAAKAVFAVMALVFVLAGLALYLLQDRIGLDRDTARLVSTALLVTGAADTLVLYFWDRLFGRRG